MNFSDKLANSSKTNNSFLCVGLDTDKEKIPRHLLDSPDSVFTFNQAIIKTTSDLVCAYKINIAFYEAEGDKGFISLKKTVDFITKSYPEIPVILDAKRGDIENTNLGYVKMAFDWLGVDAITLHPYLGKTALLPFLELKEKFFFILCRTSNEGAEEFQNLEVGGERPLYQFIAEQVSQEWNFNKNCGLVVGATCPEELSEVRKIVGEMLILIPGIGAQGGDLEKTIKAAERNFIINSSRGIIYVSGGKDFAQAARIEALKLRNEINKYL